MSITPRLIRRLVVLVFWAGACSLPSVAQSQVSPQGIDEQPKAVRPEPLQPGESREQDLVGGANNFYKLDLPAGQLLHIEVEQLGIDVTLTISSLSGDKLSEVDRPNGSRGRESISVIIPTAGSYLLEVRSLESVAAQGRYRLRVDPLSVPKAEDLVRIAAEQAVSKAERFRAVGTVEAFRQAISEFNRAEELWGSLKERYEQAVALYGSGMSCTALGENQKGIEYLVRTLSLFDHDAHGKAITVAALGWPYMYLGDTENAERSFIEAFELYHAEGNVRGEGVALFGLGWVDALQGRNQEALQKFSDSLNRRRSARDRRGEALTLAGIGKIEARLGDQIAALASLNQALDILSGRDHYAEADIRSNIGWIYISLNNNLESLKYFNQALVLRREVGDRVGQATTLYGLSDAHRRLGHLQEALTAISNAVDIIESLRTLGSSQQLRISYFASVQDYYDYYIDLLMVLNKSKPSMEYAAKALHVCERARARGLIDLLSETKIDLREGIDPTLLEMERIATEKLTDAGLRRYELLNASPTPEQIVSSTRELEELSRQVDSLKARIREANPRYAAIVQPEALTVEQMQRQLLDEHSIVLEYALGENRSYLWVVTTHDVATFELPGREEIERIARPMYDQLTARNTVIARETDETKRARVAESDAKAHAALRELSQILLAPAVEKLGARKLLLVTKDVLQFIPFAALPLPLSSGVARLNYRSQAQVEQPLLANHEIVSLPSVTTLAVLRREATIRKLPVKEVVVFADPVYGTQDGRVRKESMKVKTSTNSTNGSSAIESSFGEFPRLVSAMWEGKRIAELVPNDQSKLFAGFAASRSAAMSPEIGKYRFLHFAAHALIDNEHPDLSGIALAMINENQQPQNGFLRSSEIFNLKLSSDLVVLSACRTGLGRDFKGEGLVGLTRAFMYAGAPRVVSSLWDIEDKPTSELMVRFYKHMLGPEKQRPAAALRSAQMELSKDPRWQEPYFWAGFILQGDWK